jgi:hypothetical protein
MVLVSSGGASVRRKFMKGATKELLKGPTPAVTGVVFPVSYTVIDDVFTATI